MADSGQTSKELFLRTLSREQNDYVPFFPRDLTLGMDVLDIRTGEIFDGKYNSELSAECVLKLQEFLGNDATVGCIFSYSLEAFGGTIKYSNQ